MARARGWTCNRQMAGVKCRTHNPPRTRKCRLCSKPRPKRVRPKHMAALQQDYAAFVAINGGKDECGICGRKPNGVRRLHRDHSHKTGKPRGVLCFRDNSALRSYMTVEWLRAALAYLERTEDG